jgi:NADPH-dependent 2,4-dienoyl-CoA reductase/sulfur reductase-like enzyme
MYPLNCGRPYSAGKTIPDCDDLLLQTPERFWKRFRVRVHVLHEVLHIDRKPKCVQVKNLMTQEITSHPYDTLILAPGGGAIIPDIPGIHVRNIFTVKTVSDSDAIKIFDELRDLLQHLDPPQETVVYCRVGLRGYLAERILLQHGFTHVFNLTGGY